MWSEFAEVYAVTVSAFIRYVLSALTGFFSLSLAEIIVLVLPLAVIVIAFLLIVLFFKNKQKFKILLRITISLLLLIFSLFVNIFGVCYFRKPVDISMDFAVKKLNREEMYLSTAFIKKELESTLDNVLFSKDGSSQNKLSWRELDNAVDTGFDNLRNKYTFISDIKSLPKKVLLSEYMTYTHISGVYFPFTGEANINTNYPDYVVAFTVAHEKAHQRGIASEDEANFIAFLACLYSDDDYLRYCALMNMYDYYLDSIYAVDKEMYDYFIRNTDIRVLMEMKSYSDFFDKYRSSKASKVADTVNDTYIKAMGDKNGVNSYGKVVELVSGYINKNNGLP